MPRARELETALLVAYVCKQIQRDTGLWYSAEYSTFSISDEVGQYRLTVAGYSGDAGDAMRVTAGNPDWISNGMMFSTPGNDNSLSGKCAKKTGWWYRWCSISGINKVDKGHWWTGSTAVMDVQASRMLVKLN